MKLIRSFLAVAFMSMPIASFAFCQGGMWSYAFRGGASLYTQRANTIDFTDTSGDTGSGILKGSPAFLADTKVGYAFNEYFSLGVELDWESHKFPGRIFTDTGGDTFLIRGRFETISLMPYIEFRPFSYCSFTPYLSVAAGQNFNWTSAQSSNISRFKPNNTFAAKGAVGFDILFANNVAFNTEVGWKLNRGRWTIEGTDEVDDDTTATGNYNTSAGSLLVGLRFFY